MTRLIPLLVLYALLLPWMLPDQKVASSLSPELSSFVREGADKVENPALSSNIYGLNKVVWDGISSPENTLSSEDHCLAQAVYFEARGESIEGQLAVAQVVLNRVKNRRYPSSICGVVFQNERLRHRCQFSFACDGRSDRPREVRAWDLAIRVSQVAKLGLWTDITGSATHYHATYVDPGWNDQLQHTATFGQHQFYR